MLSPIDTRVMFRPVSRELIALLRRLEAGDWDRPTVAGSWLVRDVVAHLIDTRFRRLSFQRDRMDPPPPRTPIRSDRDFVDFINGLNAQWVETARRLSPRVLTDLLERASRDVADWIESIPLDGPALFPVTWAGEQASQGWFDIGREFTELWHHQEQIRMAVGAPSLSDPRYLRAVLDIAVRGLPHAYRGLAARPGETVVIDISGPAGGVWTLVRERNEWTICAGEAPAAATRVTLRADDAWKLLFNALSPDDAARHITTVGRAELATPLLRARSVIV